MDSTSGKNNRAGCLLSRIIFISNIIGLFFFAGFWDEWKGPAGEQIRTCTILTTRPNEVVAAVHDRMPVIFEKETAWSWLQPGQPVERLLTLLGPFPAEQMAEHRVSREVNQAVIDSSLMIAPEWDAPTLF